MMFARDRFSAIFRSAANSARTLRLVCGVVFVASVALGLPACGSRVGEQITAAAPLAVITPIGNVATSAAGADPVTITVRSGADVVLSAKDSDGRGIALTGFTWKYVSGPQLATAPNTGALLYRNNNTVSFTAPQITSASDPVKIQLTITNAKGATATANVAVTVIPANDPSRFLIAPQAPATSADNRFTVAVLTGDGFGTTPTSTLPSDQPVCVQVVRQITYNGRDTLTHTTPATAPGNLQPLQADVSWAKGSTVLGTASGSDADIDTAAQSYSNPRTSFSIPSLNDEELFALYNQPGTSQPNLQLEASDIDSASLQLSVEALPGSCDGSQSAGSLANRPVTVAILDSTGHVLQHGTPGGAVSLTADQLRASVGTAPVQTAASAQAYYQAIDPNAFTNHDSKATLNGWLTANCFDPTVADYGTGKAGAKGAHAVYTNNFDLGFGRDMYFITCSADQTDQYGNTTAHAGDMASVVINYPFLEEAALKDGPVIAVAMEYSAAADGSGRRFPKFYVYAPDDRTGDLKRILSANFDRRGQKYIPGACTACHGGNLPSLPPSFAGSSQASACTPGPSFNVNACYPLVHDPTAAAAAMCAPQTSSAACLAAGDVDAAFLPWDADAFLYSSAPSTANSDPSFLGNLVSGTNYTRAMQEPALKALNLLAYATWQPELETVSNGGTSTVQIDRFAAARSLVEQWYGGPAFPSATYTDLTDTAPPPGWANQPSGTPIYHGVFARNCRTCHTVNADPLKQFSGFNAGLTGDGYTLFSNTFTQTTKLGQSYVFQQGIMPLARLTMDRFWVDFANPTDPTKSAANALAVDQGFSGSAAALGTPLAQATATIANTTVATESSLTCGSTSLNALQRGDTVRLSADQSDFAASSAWTFSYTDCDPKFASTSVLVGKQGPEAAFSPDKPGLYTATLAVANGTATAQQIASFLVQNKVPTITGPVAATPVAFPAGQNITLTGTLGDGLCADHSVSILQQGSKGTVSVGACGTSGTAGTFAISLSYLPTVVGMDSFTVSVQDEDGDSSAPPPFTVSVNVTTSLSTPTNETMTASAGTSATTPTLAATSVNRCELNFDSLGGESAIALSVGNGGVTSQGGQVSVLTDTTGAVCGGAYTGKPYLKYTAPAHYIGADSFNYTIAGSGGAGDTSTGAITVSITGSKSFATDIFPTLNATGTACASCHGTGGAYKIFLPALNGTPTNATTISFYNAICGANPGPCQAINVAAVAPAPGGTLVTVGDSSNSQLYLEPNSPSSGTMPTDAAFAAVVKTWLEEGAYCTTTGAACPP